MMVTHNFKPLRLVKKTGKITVASYSNWRRIKCKDWVGNQVCLIREYDQLDPSAHVYNHKGHNLFFPNVKPWDIPAYSLNAAAEANLDFSQRHSIDYGNGQKSYWGTGIDNEGVPTFSFFTSSYVAQHCSKQLLEFEPLTVEMVADWAGWFLYNLQRCEVKI